MLSKVGEIRSDMVSCLYCMVCVWCANLRQRGLVQVQLQPLDHVREIGGMETHHVFGYARRLGGAAGRRGGRRDYNG